MEFDDRRHLVVDDLSDDLFKKVIGYCFCKYDLAGPGCVRMITEDAEELQLSGKEPNELNFYTEWSKLFPVLRYFTYDGCRLDFSKEVKHWKCVKNVYGQPVVIRKPIYEEIAKGLSNSDLAIAKWDDILIDYAENHFAKEKSVMVLTVIHPYDTVEVLGVFDDKTALRKECITIVGKDKYLVDDISNLHIYECPLNKMIGVFYPDDYDNADSMGSFFEEQIDISAEVLGEEFLEAKRETERFN